MAVPGTPLIPVVDISRVVARVNIPQSQGNLIKVGQPAEVIQADSGQQVPGKVIVVSPATDANSTTLQVWVQAENPGERLKPGSSVHVKVIVVSPATDANRTTLRVWVQAENPGERLKPGSRVHVKVIVVSPATDANRTTL